MMVLRPGEGQRSSTPDGFLLRFVEDAASLREILRVQQIAFGDKAISGEIDVSGLEHDIAKGGRYLAAFEMESGAVVGAGAYMPPQVGVTEVVGIAVLENARRQGLGQALASSLAFEAFKGGCVMAFLAPGGRQQEAIYTRAGFVSGAGMLYIGKPS